MKIQNLIKPLLIIAVLVTVLTGCKKDEMSNVGKVSINIYNASADLTITIFTTDNNPIAITDNLHLDKNKHLTVTLNIGNYIIKPFSSTYYVETGFQVQPGKTTEIMYDTQNLGHVL